MHLRDRQEKKRLALFVVADVSGGRQKIVHATAANGPMDQ